MSVVERIPTSRRGQGLALGGAVTAWVAAYWVNGWLWDRVLYDGLGMAPAARASETIHFFLYDTLKIALLLVVGN